MAFNTTAPLSHHTIKTYNKYIIAYVYTAFNLCALPFAEPEYIFSAQIPWKDTNP